jgi:dTDP-4-dehydrorhamnose reductase
VGRPARRRHLEHPLAASVGTGQGRGILITGAGGQLGTALAHEFPEAQALGRAQWDVTFPWPWPGSELPDLVLHAAAWTDVDGAEGDPQGAAAVNVGGTQHVAALGVPLVYYSTDYVFDGTKTEPYLESDAPNPLGGYARSKLYGEAAAGERASERDEVAVVDDQRGCPTYVGHLARATRSILELPAGVYHVAGAGDCTWADFAEAIFAEAGLDCGVRRITTSEFGAKAARPAYSVLRSEKAAPALPHWREGLRECLDRIGR